MGYILTLNAGSSSIRAALFAVGDELTQTHAATIERIGQPEVCLITHAGDGTVSERHIVSAANHAQAVAVIYWWLQGQIDIASLRAIGHRIVHGGPQLVEPVLLSDGTLRELEKLRDFDPTHVPAALELIHELQRAFPDKPQVACFDTAFFHDLPHIAQLLPLPHHYQEQGLRRFGFHGLSYEYLLGELRHQGGNETANGRVILAHLGSGASLAALKDGQPVDTTMAFTPASGIMMGSRSGDLDPGIVTYLHAQAGIELDRFNHMVNFESGLLGVSGSTADMLTLLEHEADDRRAADAINLFCYQIVKTIGAFSAVLGGLDVVVFSGGIGQNSAPIRARICASLKHFGLVLDAERNVAGNGRVSANESTIKIYAIPTNEELVLARHVNQTIKGV